MTRPTDDSDRTAQVNAIYQAIGHFFVEFSQLQLALERGISIAINGDFKSTLAALVELTADPLVKAWQSAMSQADDVSADEINVIREIAKEIHKLITLRNDWAHGHWFVGWDAEAPDDGSEASLQRLKNAAGGVVASKNLELRPTASYIEAVAIHVSVVGDAVNAFSLYLSLRRQGRLSTRPGDRVRVIASKGERTLEASLDGSTWQSTALGKL
jgi:hypothetical protein